jgi:aryl carrier-like protein
MPIDPERTSQLREKMLEHLEAAPAIADETQDGEAGNLIERALDSVRAAHWPTLDPNLETFRKGKRSPPLG